MGCCGVSVKDDEKKQNIQVFKPYNGQNPVTINIKGNQKTINNLEISNNTKDKISTELNQEKKDEYKKGVNLTEEQAEVICDILFNHIIGNNEEKDDPEILDDVKLKMGFCDVNRDNIKNIMFRGQNPTKEEIEDVYMQFKSIISPKLFVIELIE